MRFQKLNLNTRNGQWKRGDIIDVEIGYDDYGRPVAKHCGILFVCHNDDGLFQSTFGDSLLMEVD